MATGRAIAGQLGASAGPIHTSKDLVGLLSTGREDISDLMGQSGRRLGVLIGTLMATLNPRSWSWEATSPMATTCSSTRSDPWPSLASTR